MTDKEYPPETSVLEMCEGVRVEYSCTDSPKIKVDKKEISPLPWVNHIVKTDCGHCHCIGNQEQIEAHRKSDKPTIPSYACLYVDYNKAERQAQANAEYIVEACNNYQKLKAEKAELLECLRWFCNRVDKGEVRSTKTYNKFKQLLSKFSLENLTGVQNEERSDTLNKYKTNSEE